MFSHKQARIRFSKHTKQNNPVKKKKTARLQLFVGFGYDFLAQQYFIKCLFGVKIAEEWHVLNSYDLYYDLSISVAYDRHVMSILLNKAYSGWFIHFVL